MKAMCIGRAAFRGARFALGCVLLAAFLSSPAAADETPTVAPSESPIGAPAPTRTPTPTPLPEYLVLSAEKEDEHGNVRLHYTCDFQRFDYRGAPVDIYLAAAVDPAFSEGGVFSLGDLFASGEVRILRGDMRTYVSNGVVEGPTFRGAVFTSTGSGSLLINTVSSEIFSQPFADRKSVV